MKVNGTIAKGIITMTCFTHNYLFFIIHFCFCTVANFRNLYHSTTTSFTDYLCNKKINMGYLPFLTTFTQLTTRLKNIFRGWLLVLGIKSEVILLNLSLRKFK